MFSAVKWFTTTLWNISPLVNDRFPVCPRGVSCDPCLDRPRGDGSGEDRDVHLAEKQEKVSCAMEYICLHAVYNYHISHPILHVPLIRRLFL